MVATGATARNAQDADRLRCDLGARPALRILIHELTREEDKALDEWVLKKQDKSVLEKLRDRAYNAWMYRQDKLEQAAVDEWSVQKQRAA